MSKRKKQDTTPKDAVPKRASHDGGDSLWNLIAKCDVASHVPVTALDHYLQRSIGTVRMLNLEEYVGRHARRPFVTPIEFVIKSFKSSLAATRTIGVLLDRGVDELTLPCERPLHESVCMYMAAHGAEPKDLDAMTRMFVSADVAYTSTLAPKRCTAGLVMRYKAGWASTDAGMLHMIKFLHARGYPIQSVRDTGVNILHAVITEWRLETARELVRIGADVMETEGVDDTYESSLVTLMGKYSSCRVTPAWLENVDVELRRNLDAAVEETVNVMLDHTADVSTTSVKHESGLIWHARHMESPALTLRFLSLGVCPGITRGINPHVPDTYYRLYATINDFAIGKLLAHNVVYDVLARTHPNQYHHVARQITVFLRGKVLCNLTGLSYGTILAGRAWLSLLWLSIHVPADTFAEHDTTLLPDLHPHALVPHSFPTYLHQGVTRQFLSVHYRLRSYFQSLAALWSIQNDHVGCLPIELLHYVFYQLLINDMIDSGTRTIRHVIRRICFV